MFDVDVDKFSSPNIIIYNLRQNIETYFMISLIRKKDGCFIFLYKFYKMDDKLIDIHIYDKTKLYNPFFQRILIF